MLFVARWLVKLIPFSDFDYLIPLGYKNQGNCKIAGKNFKIKYHVTHCTLVHIPVYMNRVLPKWYKEVSSYLSLDCTFRKGLLHGMSYTPEKHEVTFSVTRLAG